MATPMARSLRAVRVVLATGMLASSFSLIGLADSLALSTWSVGASALEMPRCTNAGVLVVPNLSGANVVSVTVSSLPSACGSATIQAAVHNGVAAAGGTATVPAGGGSVSVSLASAVAAATGLSIDVVITGP